MPIGESHECVRSRRRIQLNQCLKLFDGPFRLAGHQIALAQRGVEIDALRRDFQTGFQEWDRIFKIILRHADPRQEKDDVRIQGSQLVCTNQQIQSIDCSRLIRVRSEEHTSELQSLTNLVCRLLLEKKKKNKKSST